MSLWILKRLFNFNNNKPTFTPANVDPPKNTNGYTHQISHQILDKFISLDKFQILLESLHWNTPWSQTYLHKHPLALLVHVAERTHVTNNNKRRNVLVIFTFNFHFTTGTNLHGEFLTGRDVDTSLCLLLSTSKKEQSGSAHVCSRRIE